VKEHECKHCGGPLVFKGSVLSGRAECPTCDQPVTAWDPAAAIEYEEVPVPKGLSMGSFVDETSKFDVARAKSLIEKNNRLLADMYGSIKLKEGMTASELERYLSRPIRSGKSWEQVARLLQKATRQAAIRGPVAIFGIADEIPTMRDLLARAGIEVIRAERRRGIFMASVGEAGTLYLIPFMSPEQLRGYDKENTFITARVQHSRGWGPASKELLAMARTVA
jgi:hypothetical protein